MELKIPYKDALVFAESDDYGVVIDGLEIIDCNYDYRAGDELFTEYIIKRLSDNKLFMFYQSEFYDLISYSKDGFIKADEVVAVPTIIYERVFEDDEEDKDFE